MNQRPLALLVATALSGTATADTVIRMHMVDANGIGADAGTITISESRYGLVFTPTLRGLTPGLHGFHVHENPSCEPKEKDRQDGRRARGRRASRPGQDRQARQPWGDGHLGDLPPLYVAADGTATQPVLGPRLKASDVADRSLMVHAVGDNHADHPAPLGGGGARMACGVVK